MEINHKLSTKTVFCRHRGFPNVLTEELEEAIATQKIDVADAYNQILLAPESQQRLALSTHKGVLLLQKRLSFGKSSAPGYF